MTGFTKHDCSAIRADMQAALADVYAKHGIDPDARITMRYGATLKITIEAARLVEGDNGVNVASKEATDWVSYCAPWNGYDPDAIGREVVMPPLDRRIAHDSTKESTHQTAATNATTCAQLPISLPQWKA